MSEERQGEVSNAQIMHSIGLLTGTVKQMHDGLTARIEDIRADLRRLEASQNGRMDRIEDGLNKRIDGISTRVVSLEAEDKRLIEKTAKLSALGGGIGGALAAAAVELIKRI